MNRKAAVFELSYRAQGYDAEDERQLRQSFEELGAVRLRSLNSPEAGRAAELCLVASFVGTPAVPGLMAHLTNRLYDSLSERLVRFCQSRHQRDKSEPRMSLRVSYDDLEITVVPVMEADLASLPGLVAQVHRHLDERPLRDARVSRIVVGMVQGDDDWSEPSFQRESADGKRFWGISLEGYRAITLILDIDTGRFNWKRFRNRGVESPERGEADDAEWAMEPTAPWLAAADAWLARPPRGIDQAATVPRSTHRGVSDVVDENHPAREISDSTPSLIWAALEQLDRLAPDLHTLRERLESLMPTDVTASPFVVSEVVDLEGIERLYIEHTLRRVGGNKTQAADALRIDPSTLHRKLARWEDDQSTPRTR